ncbi:MAG: DUF4330 domain-containing protein [Oscillospiraceae bacterium]|jgi:hypothetical protein|nr:DUF4330 domain-containing protein [Oscillospiraceae bacterium]
MKSKFKLRLNLFDIVIIILALAAGFLLLRLSNADGGGGTVLNPGKQLTARYTLELSNLPLGTAELIKPGDRLTEVVEKRFVGSVVSVEITPYLTTSKDTYTGDFILTEVPERRSAVITLDLPASDTGSEINASGFVLRGGINLSVTGPGYAGVGLVINVER